MTWHSFTVRDPTVSPFPALSTKQHPSNASELHLLPVKTSPTDLCNECGYIFIAPQHYWLAAVLLVVQLFQTVKISCTSHT
jgi:hypothetical protein